MLLFRRLCNIHISGQQLNCEMKKKLTKKFFFSVFIYGVALAKALSFLLAFLHISSDMPPLGKRESGKK